MKQSNNEAVSPVVGVMLMLIVTIIIAALVSAFAGGALGNSQKTPQANIKGAFSTSGGMQLIHAGGDTIPTQDLVFMMTHDPTFGTGLEAVTTQVLNRSMIQNVDGKFLVNYTTGLSEVDASFKPGDTLYVSTVNTRCVNLQPQIAPNKNGNWDSDYLIFTPNAGMGPNAFYGLCFRNPDSVGKTFTLTVLDKRTNGVISKNTVTITN